MNATEKTVFEIEEQSRENAREEQEYWADPAMIRNDELQDLISTLNSINYQVAELLRIKEELEPRVAKLLEHGDDGSKTYTAGRYKVTCKSGWIYSLNKEEYEINGARMPACFKVVKQRIAYDVDKNAIKDIEKYGNADDLNLLASFVSKKPSKLNIKITAGV